MKANDKQTSKASRRVFFGKSVLAGLAVMIGLTSAKTDEEEKGETVKMLTPDGQLMEVEKKHLPQKQGKKISNRKLFEWMHSNKQK